MDFSKYLYSNNQRRFCFKYSCRLEDPMYICECGEEFEELNEAAQDHVLEFHLDLVETAFEDYIEEADYGVSEEAADDLYEDAVNEVVDDMFDEILEG